MSPSFTRGSRPFQTLTNESRCAILWHTAPHASRNGRRHPRRDHHDRSGLASDQVDELWHAAVSYRPPTNPALVGPYKRLIALIDGVGKASAARKKAAREVWLIDFISE
jgi:hypothetical protein